MTRRFWYPVLFAALLTACGADDDGAGGGTTATGNASSSLCSDVAGGEAILWDLYNGLLRTDSVLPPPIPSPGQVFSHPSQPLLGFVYPMEWTAETIDGGIHNLGVNIIRNDSLAIWRQQTETVDGQPSAREVRDFELDQTLAFFGARDAAKTTVCVNEGTADAGGGILVSFSNTLVRAGDQTVVVTSAVTPFPGLPNSSLRRQVVAAPTAEFPTRAVDTFLAIDFQMMLGETSNLFDSDGDGWRDGVDQAPSDPTRH